MRCDAKRPVCAACIKFAKHQGRALDTIDCRYGQVLKGRRAARASATREDNAEVETARGGRKERGTLASFAGRSIPPLEPLSLAAVPVARVVTSARPTPYPEAIIPPTILPLPVPSTSTAQSATRPAPSPHITLASSSALTTSATLTHPLYSQQPSLPSSSPYPSLAKSTPPLLSAKSPPTPLPPPTLVATPPLPLQEAPLDAWTYASNNFELPDEDWINELVAFAGWDGAMVGQGMRHRPLV